jgi:predicted nucleotidyltransferase
MASPWWPVAWGWHSAPTPSSVAADDQWASAATLLQAGHPSRGEVSRTSPGDGEIQDDEPWSSVGASWQQTLSAVSAAADDPAESPRSAWSIPTALCDADGQFRSAAARWQVGQLWRGEVLWSSHGDGDRQDGVPSSWSSAGACWQETPSAVSVVADDPTESSWKALSIPAASWGHDDQWASAAALGQAGQSLQAEVSCSNHGNQNTQNDRSSAVSAEADGPWRASSMPSASWRSDDQSVRQGEVSWTRHGNPEGRRSSTASASWQLTPSAVSAEADDCGESRWRSSSIPDAASRYTPSPSYAVPEGKHENAWGRYHHGVADAQSVYVAPVRPHGEGLSKKRLPPGTLMKHAKGKYVRRSKHELLKLWRAIVADGGCFDIHQEAAHMMNYDTYQAHRAERGITAMPVPREFVNKARLIVENWWVYTHGRICGTVVPSMFLSGEADPDHPLGTAHMDEAMGNDSTENPFERRLHAAISQIESFHDGDPLPEQARQETIVADDGDDPEAEPPRPAKLPPLMALIASYTKRQSQTLNASAATAAPTTSAAQRTKSETASAATAAPPTVQFSAAMAATPASTAKLVHAREASARITRHVRQPGQAVSPSMLSDVCRRVCLATPSMPQPPAGDSFSVSNAAATTYWLEASTLIAQQDAAIELDVAHVHSILQSCGSQDVQQSRFGSRVVGTANVKSDLDICVDVSGTGSLVALEFVAKKLREDLQAEVRAVRSKHTIEYKRGSIWLDINFSADPMEMQNCVIARSLRVRFDRLESAERSACALLIDLMKSKRDGYHQDLFWDKESMGPYGGQWKGVMLLHLCFAACDALRLTANHHSQDWREWRKCLSEADSPGPWVAFFASFLSRFGLADYTLDPFATHGPLVEARRQSPYQRDKPAVCWDLGGGNILKHLSKKQIGDFQDAMRRLSGALLDSSSASSVWERLTVERRDEFIVARFLLPQPPDTTANVAVEEVSGFFAGAVQVTRMNSSEFKCF